MRILHCPGNVGGNAWGLSRAERKLGMDSTLAIWDSNYLGYQTDVNLHMSHGSRFDKGKKLLEFFLWAIRNFDILHFNFGSSIIDNISYLPWLDLADLPIMKALGKKVVVTYQGCDARQKDYSVTHFGISACSQPDCYGGICSPATDARKRKRIKKVSRFANRIYSLNPDLLHVLPERARFLPYTSVDIETWLPVKKAKGNKFVIVHSPTNRAAKGTQYIEDAIRKIMDKYKFVEFQMVEGIARDRAKELYQQADLAIDQLLAGWYGGFALEMMALEKPVICFLRDDDLKLIPQDMAMDIPIIRATPGDILEVLENCLGEYNRLKIAGERGRHFAEKYHNPVEIAKNIYNNL